MSNVPRLRFKADDGSEFPEWEEKTLGEEAEFYNGIAHENNVVENGRFVIVNSKFISSEGKVKKYSNKAGFLLNSGDIVMVMSDVPNGKAIAKCYLIEKDNFYTLNQRICCLRTKHNKLFLLNQINRNKYFLKFDDGIKQTNLRKDDILKCPINIAAFPEQQKIADFLSTIDEIIAKSRAEVEAWEERKKGVMQKIFSQEVRFKVDDGSEFPEWEEKKLRDIADRITRKNKSNETDIPLTISSIDGLVDQRTYFGKTIASKDMSGYYLLKNGEFAYNKSYSKGFDFGSIKRLDNYEQGALSTLYICFTLKNGYNSDFMTYYFASQTWNKEVAVRCAEGARNHGLLNISVNDFFDISIKIPKNVMEQQKIADCLSSIDEVIKKCKKELAAWETFKKGLLQQMFV